MTTREAMIIALEEARQAALHGDVPVGAVMLRGDEFLCADHNRREERQDPTAHAEMLVIRTAAELLHTRQLSDCTLVVTLEPCPMCAGALSMSGVRRCVFGARDERQGCCESVYALPMDPAFYHRCLCVGGLMEEECAGLLRTFFSSKREKEQGS